MNYVVRSDFSSIRLYGCVIDFVSARSRILLAGWLKTWPITTNTKPGTTTKHTQPNSLKFGSANWISMADSLLSEYTATLENIQSNSFTFWLQNVRVSQNISPMHFKLGCTPLRRLKTSTPAVSILVALVWAS